MFETASIAELQEFKFGHAQDQDKGTGCTVVVAPKGAVCGVDVRGGGPATRETDLLRPENMIEAVHAVVMAGGSAFGLEASCGVMEELAMRNIGFQVENVHVPIVTSACIFDLLVGDAIFPDKEMGKQATCNAFADAPLGEGNVGAGMGASVGKLLGSKNAMKSGFGMSFLRSGELIVGALVVVNAVGNIMNPDGSWLAGCLDKDNHIVDSLEAFEAVNKQLQVSSAQQNSTSRKNTTLGIVVTNADVTKAETTKISSICHDALARSIKPVHTSQDGDAIFTLASGKVEALSDYVAVLATEAMQQAIYRSVRESKTAFGLQSVWDITP